MSEGAPYTTKGFDQYGGSRHTVAVEHDAHHVLLSVEATSGSQHGEALLTPGQARSVAAWLMAHAQMAEAHSYQGRPGMEDVL